MQVNQPRVFIIYLKNVSAILNCSTFVAYSCHADQATMLPMQPILNEGMQTESQSLGPALNRPHPHLPPPWCSPSIQMHDVAMLVL